MSKKLYVGNLPYSTTKDSLKEMFSPFGTVESVTIITDRVTGRSKGFGFVELATELEAAGAIEKMKNTVMGGKPLAVSDARPHIPREGDKSRGGGFSL